MCLLIGHEQNHKGKQIIYKNYVINFVTSPVMMPELMVNIGHESENQVLSIASPNQVASFRSRCL